MPTLVSLQDLNGCIESAKRKLALILQLSDQLMADLPAAYMEAYEFLAIAKVGKYLYLLIPESPVFRL